MSKLDVQLLRGVPATMEDRIVDGAPTTDWFYLDDKGEAMYFLSFGKVGLQVVCRIEKFAIELRFLYGVKEDDVIAKLGRPTKM